MTEKMAQCLIRRNMKKNQKGRTNITERNKSNSTEKRPIIERSAVKQKGSLSVMVKKVCCLARAEGLTKTANIGSATVLYADERGLS